jgi:branched-chain amino acid transport system permease protein
MCCGQQIIMGWASIFNLAQIALCAVGAYTFAILSTEYQLPFYASVFIAVLNSVVFGIPLALISHRLKSDYFAVGSLAFALVIQSILINWRSVTNGVLGITGIPRPSFFSISADDNLVFLILISLFSASVLLVLIYLEKSVFRMQLVAQADFDECLLSIGINSGSRRMLSFILCSVFAGVSGALFASYISFIDPSSFGLSEMIFVLSIMVLSGFSSLRSLIFSVIFLVTLPELLRFTDIPSSVLGPVRQLLYALTLFIFVYLRRNSIFYNMRSI